MIRTKRNVSLLLAAVFLGSSLLPSAAYAAERENEVYNVVAQEVEGFSALNDKGTEPHKQPVEDTYDENDIITAIVEMDGEPVLGYYEMSTYSTEEGSGEAVSEFLQSEDAKLLSEELADEQENIISQIKKLTVKSSARSGDNSEVEVLAQWTNITNAVAVKVPYGILKDIKQLEGVKRAYVQHVYERPEELKSTIDLSKENYAYSLDMVGVEEAWADSYTGKGMLVAVLDTGIDIIQDKTNGEYLGSHEAFTENSFKSGNPEDGENDWTLRYNEESMANFLAHNELYANTSLITGGHITYDNNALFKNTKVPFGFDYADWDGQTRPTSNYHGIHVAGTIAGYCETDEGEVKFSGVAPDAQLLAMKVFPDENGGAEEISVVCALEDSMVLGADIINLSLGSDNGFAEDDSLQKDIYARVEEAGVVMMTSAGNSSYSTASNNYGGEAITENPDTSMMSSPAIYASNLSVASIDNTVDVRSYLYYSIDGVQYEAYFSDTQGSMAKRFTDKEYQIYNVGGVGKYEDFSLAGFNNGYNNGKTGIALVKRGEISFSEKIKNASYFHGVNYSGEEYGVLGCIIYDNNPEGTELINMSVDGSTISSCFISGKDGAAIAEALEAGKTVSIKTASEPKLIESETAGQMSSFSSWGAGPALELKPEITAPGGNVWSSVKDPSQTDLGSYTGTYEMMSGTSMAAPHMSGIGALVRQRVYTSSEFAGVLTENIGDIVSQLLVSTALPQKDTYGNYYSPRQQGAGLVSASAAVKTPVYISVNGKNSGKLELYDDPEKDGKYDIEFNLHNVSSADIEYEVSLTLMRPAIGKTETQWGTRDIILDRDETIKTVNLGTVTAKANGVTEFSSSASLTDAEKEELSGLFKNGIFVEGYVVLNDKAGENPQLGLPMLSFFGDWTSAPIFDSGNWLNAEDGETIENNETSWSNNMVGSVLYDNSGNAIGFYTLGENVFNNNTDDYQKVFHEENVTLSPNGDGYFDYIDEVILYQLREARVLVAEARNADTNELYFHQTASHVRRSSYNASQGFIVPMSLYYGLSWDGTDLEGNKLPSGTNCVFTITAYGDGDYSEAGQVYDDYYEMDVTNYDNVGPGEGYVEPTFNGHAMDKAGDVISFNVKIDATAPKLQNSAVSIYEEDGRTYMEGTVHDEDGSLASVEIVPLVKRTYKEGYGDPDYYDYGQDVLNPFYSETIYDAGTKTLSFKADVTEYEHAVTSYPSENNYYNFTWEGNVILSCGDYGANDRSYAISVNAESGIILSQTSALLHPGDTFDLSVNNNTRSENEITRTSSNPEVATVDEYGHIEAVSPGQTIITVSNGAASAICIVAVESIQTKVLDFDLSIDSFEGLKTNGQATVKVNNLYPSDVQINEVRWEVTEDDEYAEDYASGLISVEKYSEDALAGSLYLTVGASEDKIPGGHAVLTVTINGVSRSMDISWDDIPASSEEDGLVSSELYNEQVLYTEVGVPVDISAKYSQSSKHEFGEVIFEGNGGLILDGPDYFNLGSEYNAVLVNKEGYKLPENIRIYTVYSADYEYEMYPGYGYSGVTYNNTTGEIRIPYAPYGATNKLKIVADGVEAEGNPAGELSGDVYTKPDSLYGPFDWKVTSGSGSLTAVEKSEYGVNHEIMQFTSENPGISYVTATSKDGNYSINFAVVTEPVKADKITVESHNLEIKAGETEKLSAVLSPEPTLESDTELIWTSFNEDVATVSENGTVSGVSIGYAYIKVASKANTKINNYIIVKVLPAGIVFKDADGNILGTSDKDYDSLTEDDYPETPVKEGYTFNGWDKQVDEKTGLITLTAVYEKISEDQEEPDKPVESEKPEDPQEPAEPESPIQPDNPSESEKPTEPVESEKPEDPQEPAEPENPIQPDNPSESEKPAEPEQTEEQAKPSEPVIGDEQVNPENADKLEEDNSGSADSENTSLPQTGNGVNIEILAALLIIGGLGLIEVSKRKFD